MLMDQDEHVIFDTITLLKNENRIENANAILKMMIERTLAMYGKASKFLSKIPIVTPSDDVLVDFYDLNSKILRYIEDNDQRKHELLVEYLDLLPLLTSDNNKEKIRKYILANILASSAQPTEVLVKEIADVFTSSEAAEILGVSDQTIRRWCDKGKYPDAYQTEGGHWRIPKKYFKIDLEQARKRDSFELQLDEFNASNNGGDESEWL